MGKKYRMVRYYNEIYNRRSYDFRRNRNKKKIFYWSIFFVVLLFLFVNYKDDIFNILKQSNEIKLTNSFGIKEIEIQEKEVIKLERDELKIEERVLELVNQERTRYGVHSLLLDNHLNNLAQKHSVKMMEENFFEHSNDNVGENIIVIPIYYIVEVEGCGLIYTNNQIASCMVSGWIGSLGHHQNMIDSSYSITGIGVSCDFFECKGTQNFL